MGNGEPGGGSKCGADGLGKHKTHGIASLSLRSADEREGRFIVEFK